MNALKTYLTREDVNLTLAQFGALIGKGPGDVHRYCLPLDHKDFRVPRQETMALIVAATKGAIQPNDFYTVPHLGPRHPVHSEIGT